jgi:nucleoside phosphorylase
MRQKPTEKTIKLLFAASGGICAFPGCETRLVHPESRALLGEICHISAAAPGGPRYEPDQTDRERSQDKNLIILCPTHHNLIDKDQVTYTADILRTMKAQHEDRVAARLSSVPPRIDDQQAADFVRQVADETVDFAIVVASHRELKAVQQAFPELKHIAAVPATSQTYYCGHIPTVRGGAYRVVVTLLHSIGNLEAAQTTAVLIREWNPRFIIVTGLAGGLARSSQNFGDIAVSDSIVYYEQAKVRSTGLDYLNRQFVADPTLLSGVRNVTDSSWRMRLPARPDGQEPNFFLPAIHVGAVASGEKIIAGGQEADRLRFSQRNLIAVEMESAGVASAALSAIKKVGFITIRAICDFADGSKSDDWRDYADYQPRHISGHFWKPAL